MKKDIKVYNVLFPLWMLLMFPVTWIVVLPGNFIIDSAVLLLSLKILKQTEKKMFYKKTILKVFLFGLLADIIGSAFMLFLMMVFEVGRLGDELYMTVPALIISAVCIFIFDYFISFKNADKKTRLKLALIFAIVTAPYTFLVPSSWIYKF